MRMQHSGSKPGSSGHHGTHGAPYLRLLAMAVLSFLAMYLLMYAMVDRWANVHPSVNQLYMAALMTAPMVVIELVLMGGMYPDRRFNAVIIMAALLGLVLSWFGIRWQSGVDDRQFLKSMIPHHAGALLMCRRHRLQDPELQALCRQIVVSQQQEIDLMTARLEGNPPVVASADATRPVSTRGDRRTQASGH